MSFSAEDEFEIQIDWVINKKKKEIKNYRNILFCLKMYDKTF